MHDIKAIREAPEAFDQAMARRGLGPQAAALLDLDKRRREAVAKKQDAETARNAASKQIGQAKAKGDEDEFERLRAEVGRLKDVIEAAGADEAGAGKALNDALAALPNPPAPDVPDGADEAGNVEQRRHGTPKDFAYEPLSHHDLGEPLGMDFESAARMSGARFVVLKGPVARLERALGQFMLDVQTAEHGYLEVDPPLLVRDHAMFGTGQLPKFGEDLFFGADQGSREEQLDAALGDCFDAFCRDATDKGKSPSEALKSYLENLPTSEPVWLIPTAEVSLTNLVREQILEDLDQPIKFTALTPCFRAEAGSAGRDTKGMIRQHQFKKVELVAIAREDQSGAAHDAMVDHAETILKRLGLPFRTMLLCAGDMGFAAKKTFDLEVWLPSQKTYREISSVSNCGDFQARRMNARYRAGPKDIRFVHTLNGSGLAVGRTLVAVMENYQNPDGSISIPEALQPYMGGLEKIERR